MSARRQARRRAEREQHRVDYERLWEEPDMNEWLDHVVHHMAPKVDSSGFVISLCPEEPEPGEKFSRGDAKYWVELGASIMMDKPIIAMVRGEGPIPEKLRIVADEVVRVPAGPLGPEAHRLMGEAIKRMQTRLDK